jgi:hypothetical protein
MRYVDLAAVSDQYQAQSLKEALEEQGIVCLLVNEVTNQWIGSTIQVRVPEQDSLRAVKIYGDLKAQTDKVVCPDCGSGHVEFGLSKKYKRWWPVAMLFFLISPVIMPANMVHAYTCKACNAEFRKEKY